jgi:Transposase zinc-binding domain
VSRPLLEVADLIRSAGTAFVERNRRWVSWQHTKVLLAISRCRTSALGGHVDACTRCGRRATVSYNSCRNRHCPKCQTAAHERWIEARRRELLSTPTSMWSSPCPRNWLSWPCRTKRSSTTCCSAPAQSGATFANSKQRFESSDLGRRS